MEWHSDEIALALFLLILVQFWSSLCYQERRVARQTERDRTGKDAFSVVRKRPHCVRSVLTTTVKILPYRPLARLIRAKYGPFQI